MKLYINAMEDLVEDVFTRLADEEGWCKCERCHNDIVAVALNLLPPHYVVTKKGQLFIKLEALRVQHHADIVAALTRAAAVVEKNPRHGESVYAEVKK